MLYSAEEARKTTNAVLTPETQVSRICEKIKDRAIQGFDEYGVQLLGNKSMVTAIINRLKSLGYTIEDSNFSDDTYYIKW